MRWLLRLSLSIMIGVIISFAVAVNVAGEFPLRGQYNKRKSPISQHLFISYREHQWFLIMRYPAASLASIKGRLLFHPEDFLWLTGEIFPGYTDAADSWITRDVTDFRFGLKGKWIKSYKPGSWVRMPGPGRGERRNHIVSYAFGWPNRCLTRSEVFDLSAGHFPFDSYQADFVLLGKQYKCTMPTKVIAMGMALNTAFYGSAVFALVFPYRRIRCVLRQRKGLCPRCKYDLCHNLAAGCPECGWNRTG